MSMRGAVSLRALSLALALAAVLAAAAGSGAGAVTAVDDRGERVVLGVPAQRIVALAPSITELVFAAGAGDRLVAVARYSDFPPQAGTIAQIGDASRIDIERVISLKPDLVIAWKTGNHAGDYERLKRLGFAVFVAEPDRLVAARLGRVPPRRGVHRARRAHGHAPRRQDDNRQPGRFRGRPQPAHQRQVRRRHRHGPQAAAHLRRSDHGADRRAAARLPAGRAQGGGDRHRHRAHHAHAARPPGTRIGRDHRDRAADGGGLAAVRAHQCQCLRRSAQPHQLRRREDLFLHPQPALRHHRLRAFQPLGQRRVQPLHPGVLPTRAALPQARRSARAMVPAL